MSTSADRQHGDEQTSAPETGLTSAEAAGRLATFGPNEVAQRGRISVRSSILVQLRDPLIVVLLVACAFTAATTDVADTAVILFVVVVNTVVGVTQEVRADRAIVALARLGSPVVRVRRDGSEAPVPATGLVPGDVVLLGEGDVVPADCDLVEATSLLVDEAALTGESVAVGKQVGRTEDEARLSSGTVVVKGRAIARVVATGASSTMGRIAALLDSRVRATPLQRRLTSLGTVLATVVVALCVVVLALGVARGESWEVMTVTAVSLAVAAVPESLPAVVTLSLALGARRMVDRRAVIRRLPAVETLGSVTVLATDKTGTLTEARMRVVEIWTPSRSVVLSTAAGRGAGPSLDPSRDEAVAELLRAAVLCNDASAGNRGPDGLSGLGDPTELALLGAAEELGIDVRTVRAGFPRIGEVPFDSASQSMTTAHAMTAQGAGELLVVTKGSVEALTAIHEEEHPGPDADWGLARARADELARRGLRVLALTSAVVRAGAPWVDADHHLLGLVALTDPIKPTAGATLGACRAAGILPVLVTGDHPETARAVALGVGVLSPSESRSPGLVVTGAQLASGEIRDLTTPRVFARTTPRQKVDIVTAWQRHGAIVAMTGDGVNDGPALHRADIGVAMGNRGTEVARQAADLVLANDDLSTVVAAVEEGRRVYANIRRFLVFGLAGGTAEILLMVVGPFVGLTLPLTAAQILWINLLTHGLTGVAMGAEPAAPGVMSSPPQPPAQSVLGDGLWARVGAIGLVIATCCLLVGVSASRAGLPWQTMLFVALTCLQLGVAWGLRPPGALRHNPGLPAAVVGSLALAVAATYAPWLQDLLGTSSLTAVELGLAVATTAIGWLAARLTTPIRRAHGGRSSTTAGSTGRALESHGPPW